MEPFSMKEGEQLVRAARSAIESFTGSRSFNRKALEHGLAGFTHSYGVFVTIEHYPTRTLRGCIGFPRATQPLHGSLIDAAIAAATEDPRFVPVSHHEFEDMTVEVNVLSQPEKITGISPESRKRSIKVGRDGLLIEYGYNSGLLLPLVAVEEKWNATKFLENVSMKAGLARDAWKRNDILLYRFTSQVFRELSPRGPIEEIALQ